MADAKVEISLDREKAAETFDAMGHAFLAAARQFRDPPFPTATFYIVIDEACVHTIQGFAQQEGEGELLEVGSCPHGCRIHVDLVWVGKGGLTSEEVTALQLRRKREN